MNICIQTVPVTQVIATGSVRTNSYILKNIKTKEAVIVDPGAEANKLIDELQRQEFVLKAILLTHGHFDHISAAIEIKNRLHVEIYTHTLEEELIQNCVANCSDMYGVPIAISPDVLFEDDQILTLANMEIKVIHVPGHTPGSSCFYLKESNFLFSGDTLLHEKIGRTDLVHSDREKLLANIKEKLLTLPEQVMVYPGHREYTYIGYEKRNNPYVKNTNKVGDRI